jgi:hypothetical protein
VRRAVVFNSERYEMSNEQPEDVDAPFPWASASEWGRYSTSLECLRDIASAAGDEDKLARALEIAGAGEYIGNHHAVDALLQLAGCVDWARLDALQVAGVVEMVDTNAEVAE